MIIDGHVTIGQNRSVGLEADALLATMDELGIDRALVAPPEHFVPVRNREGNELVCGIAGRSDGRLGAYAVATPWLGPDAVAELERAQAAGAVALKLDPTLQGFDLLDGGADTLVAYASDVGWPIYVRTGTPAHALPLQLAALAARFPAAVFLMGKSGAMDFSHDGPTALRWAENIYADSAHVEWPTALAASDPAWAGRRVVFTTDAPFGDPMVELARVTETLVDEDVCAGVLGATLAELLGW